VYLVHPITHPDTQAIFTSVALFNALTKSDTIQRVIPAVPFKEPLPAYSPSTQLSSGSIPFGLNVTVP
jgi:hypothetical protein